MDGYRRLVIPPLANSQTHNPKRSLSLASKPISRISWFRALFTDERHRWLNRGKDMKERNNDHDRYQILLVGDQNVRMSPMQGPSCQLWVSVLYPVRSLACSPDRPSLHEWFHYLVSENWLCSAVKGKRLMPSTKRCHGTNLIDSSLLLCSDRALISQTGHCDL